MKKGLILLIAVLWQSTAFSQWNTDRILANGQNALYFEDYLLSIQYFNQVIKAKPYLAEPYLNRGIAKIQLGDYQGADADCSLAIEKNPFLPQAYYARGFARRKMNFLSDAIHDFTKALEFSPNSFSLLMNRMDARAENKDYKGAMADLELCNRQNETRKGLHYEKARLQLALGDTVAATISFDLNLRQDSSNCMGWSARAYLKMQKKDVDGALKDYSEAIKRKSSYVGDYINRGIIYVEKKNYKLALNDYNSAIKSDPKNALAYYNRGLLRANLGDNNNALSDLKMVLQLDNSNTEALLRKAMLEITTGDYRNAIKDYQSILEIHPYFTPAYYGMSEAESALGNKKNAYKYADMARKIEANKEQIQRKEKLAANNKAVQNRQKGAISQNTNTFNRFAAQNIDDPENSSKYENSERGAVQERYTEITNEKNFALSYYAKVEGSRPTNLYNNFIDQYNKANPESSPLKISNTDLALSAELITSHFDKIASLSKQIVVDNSNPEYYFRRAIEYGLVQDFSSAIDDLNRLIELRPNFMPGYFYRGNIRFKMLDSHRNVEAKTDNKILVDFESSKLKNSQNGIEEQKIKLNTEGILQDYEMVNKLNPDFSFAYFNKGNILCTLKEFRLAIKSYDKALELDPDFVEAYFNRGLTYLFIGEEAKGLTDLSKAGELGIPKAYNIMQRFKK